MATPDQVNKWAEGIRAKIESGEWLETEPGVFTAAPEPKKTNMYTVSKAPCMKAEKLPGLEETQRIMALKQKYKRFGLKYTPRPKPPKLGHTPVTPQAPTKPANKPMEQVERGTQLWMHFENMAAGSGDAEYGKKFADSMTRLHGKYTKINKERRHILHTNKPPPSTKVVFKRK